MTQIRRKVFSRLQDENGEERLFSVNETIIEQREFAKKDDKKSENKHIGAKVAGGVAGSAAVTGGAIYGGKKLGEKLVEDAKADANYNRLSSLKGTGVLTKSEERVLNKLERKIAAGETIQKPADAIVKGAEATGAAVKKGANAAVEAGKNVAEKTSAAVKKGAGVVAESGRKTGAAVKGAAEKAGEAVKNAAEKTGAAVKGAAEKTGAAVKNAAEKTEEAVKGAVNGTRRVVKKTVKDTKKGTERAWNKARVVAKEVWEGEARNRNAKGQFVAGKHTVGIGKVGNRVVMGAAIAAPVAAAAIKAGKKASDKKQKAFGATTLYDESDNLKRMKDSDILAEKKKSNGKYVRRGIRSTVAGGGFGAVAGAAAGAIMSKRSGGSIAAGAKKGAALGAAAGGVLAGGTSAAKNAPKVDRNIAYNRRLKEAKYQAERREAKDWKSNNVNRDGYSY